MENLIDQNTLWTLMSTEIKTIITKFGPRAPGSANEKAAADYLTQYLQDRTPNHVVQESFSCYPRSFMGWPRVSAVFALISVALFALTFAGASMITMSILALSVMIFIFYAVWRQFLNYEEYIHRILPVYQKVTSQNVIGTFSPTTTVKKRVIFAAHYDSVYRFNLIHFFDVGYGYFIGGGIGLLVVFPILYVVGLIEALTFSSFTGLTTFFLWTIMIIVDGLGLVLLLIGRSPKVMFGALQHPTKRAYLSIGLTTLYVIIVEILLYPWVSMHLTISVLVIFLACLSIPFLLSNFFFLGPETIKGAIDNLSAVGVALGIAEQLKNWRDAKSENYPKNTEVLVLLTGSEEGGDRGAEAFARRHAEEYKKIPTDVFNLESLKDPDSLKIITKELTTRTICTKEIYELIMESAIELNILAKFQDLPEISGGTDCHGFIKGGLRCSGIEGIKYEDYLSWYHTERDDIPLLDKETEATMCNTFQICMKYLEKLDKKL